MDICKICKREFRQLQLRHRTRCHSCNTKIRRYRNKIKAINLLGGKCVKCGYNHPGALEFHHKDESTKSFNIGNVSHKSWKILLEEINKCELLCANCHRLEHTTRYEQDFLKYVDVADMV